MWSVSEYMYPHSLKPHATYKLLVNVNNHITGYLVDITT